MTIQASDIKFRKSMIQTDTDVNGGRKGMVQVISGARHALFPRVTKSQRIAGLTRYRKQFYCNENADDLIAYGVMIYLMRPSTADDRFYLAKGTQRDVQSEFKKEEESREWLGCGQLETALSGGETEVSLIMENDDFEFPEDSYLYLSNNTMVSQSVNEDVRVGDSVTFAAGSWSRIAHTDDIQHPNGWYVGNNEVLTIQESTNEEFLKLDSYSYTGNVLTLQLKEQVANAYSTANTYGSGCIYEDEVKALVADFTVVSTNGAYDDGAHPVGVFNFGTVEDDWTVVFTSASNFSVSGAVTGAIGTGSVNVDFEPENAETGTPYFSLKSAGFAGSFAEGDTLAFTTHPSAVPILLCEVVPAGTPQEPNNLLPLGSYTE